MIKKITLRLSALTFALMLILASAAFAVSAAEGYVDDTAGVFTEEQSAAIQQRFDEVCEKTGWNIVFHSCDKGLSGDSLKDYADRYLNDKGLSGNALLFVTDKSSGKSKILTAGEVDKYFDKTTRLDHMVDKLEPYTTAVPKDLYGAVMKFADEAVAVYDMGKSVAILESLKRIGPFAGIAGVIVGVIVFFVVKSKYKNMGKSGTYDLASNSKADLNDVEDTFVTQHTTVRTIQKDSSSGSSGGSTSSGHASRDF